eukprot:1641997-Rhodomonas_salina.1
MGPAVRWSAFRVSISNFPLSTTLAVRDQIAVRFGQSGAAAVQLESTNASVTVLTIEPPSPVCSGCVFEEGSATVDLVVQLRDDEDAKASAVLTLWAAPQVLSARFDAYGTAITVAFDQDTNQAGMAVTDVNCSA